MQFAVVIVVQASVMSIWATMPPMQFAVVIVVQERCADLGVVHEVMQFAVVIVVQARSSSRVPPQMSDAIRGCDCGARRSL